jgi:hypothetical protein
MGRRPRSRRSRDRGGGRARAPFRERTHTRAERPSRRRRSEEILGARAALRDPRHPAHNRPRWAETRTTTLRSGSPRRRSLRRTIGPRGERAPFGCRPLVALSEGSRASSPGCRTTSRSRGKSRWIGAKRARSSWPSGRASASPWPSARASGSPRRVGSGLTTGSCVVGSPWCSRPRSPASWARSRGPWEPRISGRNMRPSWAFRPSSSRRSWGRSRPPSWSLAPRCCTKGARSRRDGSRSPRWSRSCPSSLRGASSRWSCRTTRR